MQTFIHRVKKIEMDEINRVIIKKEKRGYSRSIKIETEDEGIITITLFSKSGDKKELEIKE